MWSYDYQVSKVTLGPFGYGYLGAFDACLKMASNSKTSGRREKGLTLGIWGR